MAFVCLASSLCQFSSSGTSYSPPSSLFSKVVNPSQCSKAHTDGVVQIVTVVYDLLFILRCMCVLLFRPSVATNYFSEDPASPKRQIPSKLLSLTGESPEVLEKKKVPSKLMALTGESADVLGRDKGVAKSSKLLALTGESASEVHQALSNSKSTNNVNNGVGTGTPKAPGSPVVTKSSSGSC